MKITDVRTVKVNIPIEEPLISFDIKSFGCVLVFLDTDEGITGEGLLYGFGATRLALLNELISGVRSNVIGEDPHYTARIWQKLWGETRFFGHKGIHLFGISAIDRACWDVVAKAAGKPLYQLLGAYRDKVPTYASGLWRFQDVEGLVKDAKDFVTKGFRAIKMRIGKPSMEEDIERVRAVRQAIGPDIDLMVDCNRAFTAKNAIRLGRKLEEFNLTWFEEPVQAYDLEGSAKVAAALDIPIASGEGEYTRYGFREMLNAKAADVLMPDLMRVGGITETLKVAHMAQAYDVPVSPHTFPHESMHIVAAVPHAPYVEHMPWFSPLYREDIEFKDGSIVLPQRPGIGFTYSPEAIERYRVQE